MLGIYLSGSGNTKHCVEKLLYLLDDNAESLPIESEAVESSIQKHDMIILGYMTQFSNIPIMIRDFITKYQTLWQGKQVICLTTMGLFSGDGTGCAARILQKYGANVIGGLQIRMPDSICDEKVLKRVDEKNREIIRLADEKIEQIAVKIKHNQYPQEGWCRMENVPCVTAVSINVRKKQLPC